LTAVLRDDNGQSLGVIVLAPKVFKNGKTGFHGQGKLALDGQRYQAQAQLVAIAAKSDTGGVEAEG